MKKCPFCAEEIQDEAVVCKHCSRELSVAAPPLVPARSSNYKAGALLVLPGLVLMSMGEGLNALGVLLAWIGIAIAVPWASGLARWGGGLLIASVLGVMIGGGVGSPSTASTAPAPDASSESLHKGPQAGDQLELLSTRGYETDSGSYLIVEGEVKNISDERLSSVTAHVSWYTQDGTLVTTDEALLDFNPVMPGQTSPFKTMSRQNPLAKTYKISFKRLMGGTIQTRDLRK